MVGEGFDPKTFDWEGNRQTVQDRDGLPLVLFRDDWALQHAQEKHPELKFLSAAPQLRQLAATGSVPLPPRSCVVRGPGGREPRVRETRGVMRPLRWAPAA